MNRLRVAAPLVYTVVYGSDAYYKCGALLVESLRTFGNYKGTVGMLCDREPEEAIAFIPAGFRRDLHVLKVPDIEPMCRYDASYLPAHASPVLYLDCDIIVDADISDVLHWLAASTSIHVAAETERYPDLFGRKIRDVTDSRRIGNWWGLELLRDDPECGGRCFEGLNSGIIGYDRADTFRHVGSEIIASSKIDKLADLVKYFGDQPFLNYVLIRNGGFDALRLTSLCRFAGPAPDATRSERRGFVHFVWARGEDKLAQMEAYLLALQSTDGQKGEHDNSVSSEQR